MAAVKSCASSSPPTPPAAGPHGSRRAPIFSAAWPAWRPASSTPTRTTCTSTWRSTSATRLIRSTSWNSCRPASTTRRRYSSRRCWPSPWPPRCGTSARAASPRRCSCSCGPTARCSPTATSRFSIPPPPPPAAAAIQQWLLRVPQLNVAAWLRTAADRFNRVADETGETDSIARLHLLSVFGVLLLAALIYAPHPPRKFRAEFDPKVYPAAALATLRTDPAGRIFTHDQWGDYLIYRLYPAHKVFVDGRSDFYGDDFEEKCIDVLNVKYGWEKTLTGFGVDTVLLPPNAPLSGALKE